MATTAKRTRAPKKIPALAAASPATPAPTTVTTLVNLNELALAPENVRPVDSMEGIETLADSISGVGLLQPLIVREAYPADDRQFIYVVAGQRRLAALRFNVTRGLTPFDVPVRCVLVTGDGRTISLTENIMRQEMSPLDQYDAYAAMVDDGQSIAAIARNFGTTELHVQQRLRLASLIEEVRDAYRAGKANLESLHAFAAMPGRDVQRRVFEQLSRDHYGWSNARYIKQLMEVGSVSNSDRRAVYVGKSAYSAAGGLVEVDLFASEQTERWIDVTLLDKLASDMLAGVANELREREGWGAVTFGIEEMPWAEQQGFHRFNEFTRRRDESEMSEHERATITSLETQCQVIWDRLENWDDDNGDEAERDKLEAQMETWRDEVESMSLQTATFPGDRSTAMRYISLDRMGGVRLDPVVYSETPFEGAREPSGFQSLRTPAEVRAEKTVANNGYGQTAMEHLAIHRRDAVRAALLAHPELVQTWFDYTLCLQIQGVSGKFDHDSGLHCHRAQDVAVDKSKLDNTHGAAVFATFGDHLDRSWIVAKDSTLDQFRRFAALPHRARVEWRLHCQLLFLQAPINSVKRPASLIDLLAQEINVDVRYWYDPTAKGLWSLLPKAAAIAIAKEAVNGAELPTFFKGKKVDIDDGYEAVFTGDGEKHYPAAHPFAIEWVPEPMRFKPIPPLAPLLATEAPADEGDETPVTAWTAPDGTLWELESSNDDDPSQPLRWWDRTGKRFFYQLGDVQRSYYKPASAGEDGDDSTDDGAALASAGLDDGDVSGYIHEGLHGAEDFDA